jgi:hypothetical protein
MAMGDGTGTDAAIQKKLRLLKIGLYGFVSSLVVTVFFLFFTGAVSLLGLVWTETGIIETAGNMIGSVIAFLFAAPFIFFAILIASLLMKPRGADMAPLMKPSAGAIAIIMVAGIVLSAVPILSAFIIVMAFLSLRGNGVIFFAMAYFALACLIFVLSVGYAMIREVSAVKELETDISWVRRVFRVLRVGGAGGGPEMDERSHRALTRAERIIGSSMGLVLFLIFQVQNIIETTRSVTGHGSDRTWLEVFATTDTLLALFALFIIIFSTLFIIKSVKTVFRVRGGGTQAL